MSDESMRQIAEALEASPAIVLDGHIVGGARPTGVTLALAYEGDDVALLGIDLLFWLRWHTQHGRHSVRPPRIRFHAAAELPEFVRVELDFGDVDRRDGSEDPPGD